MRSKTKRNGRHTREHWTKMLRDTMQEPAWQALSCTAQALYPWLKLEWHGLEYNNNGKIILSVRQSAERLGIATNTAAKAIHELQAKGFIVMTRMGELGVEGCAKAPTFQLTELAMPGEPVGSKLYKRWRPGHDFPVQKHSARNPGGFNGRRRNLSRNVRRSRHENCDVLASTVVKPATGRHQICDVSADIGSRSVIGSETSLSTRHIRPSRPPDLSVAASLRLCTLYQARLQ